MTNTYINTTVETTAVGVDTFDMTGTNDTLFLAGTGSLVALGSGSIGLQMAGQDEFATIDGTVYSAEGDGVFMFGGYGSSLIVNGEVSSGIEGIEVSDDADMVIVNGAVNGNAGIYLEGQGDSVAVDGSVSGADVGIAANGYGDIIHVNGSVEAASEGGAVGIELDSSQAEQIDISAKGDVFGATDGIYVQQSSGDTIKNGGHVSGYTEGVDITGSSTLTLTNDGTISGIALNDSTDIAVQNSGSISTESGPVAISLTNQSADVTIENSGTVHGNLNVDSASDQLSVQNNGNWNGQLDIGTVSSSVTNTGSISGGISFGSATTSSVGNVVDNDGTIHDGVSFSGSSGPASGDTLVNAGSIFGAVSMGVNEMLTNTGTIHGNVYFATANGTPSSDVFDNSNGIVIGSIYGGSGNDTFVIGLGSNTYYLSGVGDHFYFDASFGNDVINGFKTGPGHDTIAFSGGDFTSYAELQTHMTEVGTNTVITLEPGSTIELHGINMVHLSAADFTFG